jgi:hypothetical protein
MIPRAEKQQVLVATDRPNGRSLRRKALDEASESMFAPVLDYVFAPIGPAYGEGDTTSGAGFLHNRLCDLDHGRGHHRVAMRLPAQEVGEGTLNGFLYVGRFRARLHHRRRADHILSPR